MPEWPEPDPADDDITYYLKACARLRQDFRDLKGSLSGHSLRRAASAVVREELMELERERDKLKADFKIDFDKFAGHTAGCRIRQYRGSAGILERRKCNCGYAEAKERWK